MEYKIQQMGVDSYSTLTVNNAEVVIVFGRNGYNIAQHKLTRVGLFFIGMFTSAILITIGTFLSK